MENFRLGIGAVILDRNKNIFAFQRADFKESWQCPEGGLDKNEDEINGLYRELYEEINLKKEDANLLDATKNYIPYYFNNNGLKKFNNSVMGQKKKFFLLELKQDDFSFKFDILKNEIEFINFKTVKSSELLELVPNFKKDLYKQVLTEFRLL